MNKKKDIQTAFAGKQPEGAVPIWEIEFHAWDKFSGRHVVLGDEFAALSPAEQEKALYANAEILISVAHSLHFAALTVPGGYWEVAPGTPAYLWLPGEARLRQIEVLHEVGVGDLMLVAGSGGVMAMPGANNYVEFAYKLFDAPQEIDQHAQNCLDHGLAMARRLCDVGVEAVFTASDIADNHGLFFNPQQMDRFILPYLREWARQVKAMGMYAILHTDGDVTACMEGIAGSGLHALQAIDPVAGMDIRQVKEMVGGRLCLCGNVDCGVLVSGTPDQVYETTRSLLVDCKAGGGLVLGASNALQRAVSVENYSAMIRAWHDHGQYSAP